MTCPGRLLLTGQTESYYFCLKVQFLPKLKPEKIKYQKTRKVTMLGAYSYSQETECSAGWRKAWEETTCQTQGLKEQARRAEE